MVKFARDEEHLTVDEAAARLGLNPNTVNQQLRAGRLLGEKVAGRWFVPESEIDRYAREVRGKIGPRPTAEQGGNA